MNNRIRLIVWGFLVFILLITVIIVDSRSIKNYSKQERIDAYGIIEDVRSAYKR